MDFRYPYAWKDREVAIFEGTLFIPSWWDKYETYRFPGWESVFKKKQPIHLEYCSGNGEWITERAKNHPEINFVAVERRYDRAGKIYRSRKRLELDNLFIIFGEAHLATKLYIPKNSLEQVFVNFPDPWPKRGHAKHRLITPQFVQAIDDVMQKGAIATLATDDPQTSDLMIETFKERFASQFDNPYYVEELPDYGRSFFECLWKEKGKKIRYHRFIKT